MSLLERLLRRGTTFPSARAFVLEVPIRRLLLSPERLAERLGLWPGARVLEVGCGSGYYSVAVAQRVAPAPLDLVDLQPEMLDKARRKLESAGLLNATYRAADARALPFESEAYDVLYLVTVFGEISSSASFLAEALRLLRPGGLLSVSEQLPDPDFHRFGGLRRRVEAHGFELERRFGPAWSYTANFRKPAGEASVEAAPSSH